jgi:hypothetical protein
MKTPLTLLSLDLCFGLWLGLVFSLTNFGVARATVFRDPQTSKDRFLGVALVEGKNTWADEEASRLLDLADAQSLPDVSEASDLETCRRTLDIRYDFDWSTDDRDFIAACLRQAAQASDLPLQKNSYLSEIKNWTGPWSLTRRWPEAIEKNFEIALINGQKVAIDTRAVQLPNGPFRLVLLSSAFGRRVQVTDAAGLGAISATIGAGGGPGLVLGECAVGYELSGALKPSPESKNFVVGPSCFLPLSNTPQATNRNSTFDNQNLDFLNAKQQMTETTNPTSSRWKTWALWGFGGAVIYALVANLERKKDAGDGPPKGPPAGPASRSRRGF